MKNLKIKTGYTLIEMVIYVSILSLIFFVVINTIISFSGSYRNLKALRSVESSGVNSMERITREIRSSTSVDVTNSFFGTNPGILVLVSSDGTISTTTKFYVENGVLKVDVNGFFIGPLTVSGSSVDSLIFTRINNGISEAVKIDLTISGASGQIIKTKSYHSTVVLKNIWKKIF